MLFNDPPRPPKAWACLRNHVALRRAAPPRDDLLGLLVTAHEPYAVADCVIPAQETLFFLVGAANRDPAVFDDPERFDISRYPNPHMGFGAGIHYCLGAPLARLEAEVVFTKLLQRFASLSLVESAPAWRKLINLRGLERLQLNPAPTR